MKVEGKKHNMITLNDQMKIVGLRIQRLRKTDKGTIIIDLTHDNYDRPVQTIEVSSFNFLTQEQIEQREYVGDFGLIDIR